jgi:hypothetical protein
MHYRNRLPYAAILGIAGVLLGSLYMAYVGWAVLHIPVSKIILFGLISGVVGGVIGAVLGSILERDLGFPLYLLRPTWDDATRRMSVATMEWETCEIEATPDEVNAEWKRSNITPPKLDRGKPKNGADSSDDMEEPDVAPQNNAKEAAPAPISFSFTSKGLYDELQCLEVNWMYSGGPSKWAKLMYASLAGIALGFMALTWVGYTIVSDKNKAATEQVVAAPDVQATPIAGGFHGAK